AIGRFLSRDPVDIGNRFVYAEANPVYATDPLGLCLRGLLKGSCAGAAKRGVQAVKQDIQRNFGPPYSVGKLVQMADLLPLAPMCAVAGFAIGSVVPGVGSIAGAAVGYVGCTAAEGAIGLAALYAGQVQV